MEAHSNFVGGIQLMRVNSIPYDDNADAFALITTKCINLKFTINFFNLLLAHIQWFAEFAAEFVPNLKCYAKFRFLRL